MIELGSVLRRAEADEWREKTDVRTGVKARVMSIRSSRSAFEIRRLVILTSSRPVGGGGSLRRSAFFAAAMRRSAAITFSDSARVFTNLFPVRGIMVAV